MMKPSELRRRFLARRTVRQLGRGQPVSELDRLRVKNSSLRQLLHDNARFQEQLSDLLGLSKREDGLRGPRWQVEVRRVAKPAELLEAVRQLVAERDALRKPPD